MQTNSEANKICLFCASPDPDFWYNFKATYKDDTFAIYRCKSCRGSFVLPPPAEEYLTEFYTGSGNSHGGAFQPGNIDSEFKEIIENERQFPNSVVDAERIVAKATQLTSGTRFLDIGAGYGFFSSAARKANLDCTAIEISANCCAIFEKMNGFAPINGMLDEAFAQDNAGTFDIVLLSQVLEHLPNPTRAAENINKILKVGGICAIAVPHFGSTVSMIQGKKDMFIFPPEHINYFSVPGLKQLFERTGFETAYVDTISKYDRRRIDSKVKIKPLAMLVSAALDISLYASDKLNRGMFINAYFRKRR